jgi:hypothetical protein
MHTNIEARTYYMLMSSHFRERKKHIHKLNKANLT